MDRIRLTSNECSKHNRTIQSTKTRVNLKHKLQNMPVGIFLYYAAFALHVAMVGVENTRFTRLDPIAYSYIGSVVNVSIVALLAIKMLLERMKPNRWFIIVIATAIGFISWIQSGYALFFLLILFVVCGNGVNIRSLAGISLFVICVLLVITPLCSQLGIIENVILSRDDGTLRYSMGFNHVNTLGLYILACSTNIVVLRFDKSPVISIAVSVLAALLCISIADSRTSALLALAQIALLIVFQNTKNPKLRKRFTYLFITITVILVLCSFYFMLFYDQNNNIHALINDLFSWRPYWTRVQFEHGPLTMFGNDYLNTAPLFWENGEPVYYYVDNGFANLLLRYGIIPAIMFFLMYAACYESLAKDNQWNAILFGLFLMTIYGVTERIIVEIPFNYFLVYFASLFYGNSDHRSGYRAIPNAA